MNGVQTWWILHVVMAHYCQLVPFTILVDDHIMLRSESTLVDIIFSFLPSWGVLLCRTVDQDATYIIQLSTNYIIDGQLVQSLNELCCESEVSISCFTSFLSVLFEPRKWSECRKQVMKSNDQINTFDRTVVANSM